MSGKIWRNGGCEWSKSGPEKAHHVAVQEALSGVEKVPFKSKKDTRRWCKGKVGREHVYSEPVRLYPKFKGWASRLHEKLCRTCGKKEVVEIY